MLEFKKFSDFPRGTMYDILCDAYSYDDRNKGIWDSNWKESDDFFYENPGDALRVGEVLKKQHDRYIGLGVEPPVPYIESSL